MLVVYFGRVFRVGFFVSFGCGRFRGMFGLDLRIEVFFFGI